MRGEVLSNVLFWILFLNKLEFFCFLLSELRFQKIFLPLILILNTIIPLLRDRARSRWILFPWVGTQPILWALLMPILLHESLLSSWRLLLTASSHWRGPLLTCELIHYLVNLSNERSPFADIRWRGSHLFIHLILRVFSPLVAFRLPAFNNVHVRIWRLFQCLWI